MTLIGALFICISQAGLGLMSAGMGVLLFSQCNMAWRSFLQAEGSQCWSFDSSWCFFSAKCGSSISAKFLIYRAHTVCFCPLVTILDRLWQIILKVTNFSILSLCSLYQLNVIISTLNSGNTTFPGITKANFLSIRKSSALSGSQIVTISPS
jgi:hypothetical protein